MNLPATMLIWFDRMHSNTTARFLINGSLSASIDILSGVRQGCPWAPLLYNLVPQAMASYIKQRNLAPSAAVLGGTNLADPLALLQYADDADKFLNSHQNIPHILQAMQVFKEASGLALNHDKSIATFVGYGEAPMATLRQIAGPLQARWYARDAITILDIPVGNIAKVRDVWKEIVAALHNHMKMLTSLAILGSLLKAGGLFSNHIFSLNYGTLQISSLLPHRTSLPCSTSVLTLFSIIKSAVRVSGTECPKPVLSPHVIRMVMTSHKLQHLLMQCTTNGCAGTLTQRWSNWKALFISAIQYRLYASGDSQLLKLRRLWRQQCILQVSQPIMQVSPYWILRQPLFDHPTILAALPVNARNWFKSKTSPAYSMRAPFLHMAWSTSNRSYVPDWSFLAIILRDSTPAGSSWYTLLKTHLPGTWISR